MLIEFGRKGTTFLFNIVILRQLFYLFFLKKHIMSEYFLR